MTTAREEMNSCSRVHTQDNGMFLTMFVMFVTQDVLELEISVYKEDIIRVKVRQRLLYSRWCQLCSTR